MRVEVWSSRDARSTHVFAGPADGRLHQVVKKMIDGKISPKDRQWWSERVSSSVPDVPKSARILPRIVHPDDSLYALARKISAYVFDGKVDSKSLFLWYVRRVPDLDAWFGEFMEVLKTEADSALLDRAKVEAAMKATLVDAAEVIKSLKSPGGSPGFCTVQQLADAYAASRDRIRSIVKQPLSFRYTKDLKPVLFEPNPFVAPEIDRAMIAANGDARLSYFLSNEDAHTMEYLFAEGEVAVVHCAAYDDVWRAVSESVPSGDEMTLLQYKNGYMRKYFPFEHMKRFEGRDPSALDGAVTSALERLWSLESREKNKEISFDASMIYRQVNFMSTQPLASTQPFVEDFSRLFVDFEPTEDVQWASFYDGTSLRCKIKKTWLNAVDFKDLAETAKRNKDAPNVLFGQIERDAIAGSSFRFKIYQTGHVRLSLSFRPYAFADEARVRESLRAASENLSGRIGASLLPASLRLRDLGSADDPVALSIRATIDLTCRERKTSLPDLKRVIDDLLYPFFLIEESTPSELKLRYLRINKHKDSDIIHSILKNARTQTVEELVRTIMRVLDVDEEEARYHIERVALEDALMANRKMPRMPYGRFARSMITISRISTVGFRLRLDAVPDACYVNRIVALIKVAIDVAGSGSVPNKKSKRVSSSESRDREDDDILVDIENFLSSQQQPQEPQEPKNKAAAAASSSSDDQDAFAVEESSVNSDRLVLNMLYRADPRLFLNLGQGRGQGVRQNANSNSRYAVVCGQSNKRQPIVISDPEKQRIDAEFPGAYPDHVRYGSTPELAKRNIYICPKVWCPKSRVALSEAQFAKQGFKCPYKEVDETPIVFESSDYFPKGKQRHVALLDPKYHAEGLQMPCCNKLPMQSSDSNTNYIRSSKVYPLEQDRYGLLPPELGVIFKSKTCGNQNRADSLSSKENGGVINKRTSCYVRMGISPHPQRFLQCMARLLGAADAGALVESIKMNLSLSEFAAINGGSLCRTFMPAAGIASVSEQTWEAFRRTDTRVDTKFLSDVRDARVLRDLLVFASRERFFGVLGASSDVIVDHDMLLHLFNLGLPWLNPDGANFVVIESSSSSRDEEDKDRAFYASCPRYQGFASDLRLRRPIVYILKQDIFYEPIVHVTQKHRTTGFLYQQSAHPGATFLMDMMFAGCGSEALDDEAAFVMACMKQHGFQPTSQVVDYAFRLRGFVDALGTFVPLPRPCDLMVSPEAPPPVYLDSVSSLRSKRPYEQIASFFKRLNYLLGTSYYAPVRTINNKKRRSVGAAVLSDGTVVPVAGLDPAGKEAERYAAELNVFLAVPTCDARCKALQGAEKDAEELRESLLKVRAALTGEALEKAMFWSHAWNPFPSTYRRDKLVALLSKVVAPKQASAVAERMLIHGLKSTLLPSSTAPRRSRPGAAADDSLTIDESTLDAWVAADTPGSAKRAWRYAGYGTLEDARATEDIFQSKEAWSASAASSKRTGRLSRRSRNNRREVLSAIRFGRATVPNAWETALRLSSILDARMLIDVDKLIKISSQALLRVYRDSSSSEASMAFAMLADHPVFSVHFGKHQKHGRKRMSVDKLHTMMSEMAGPGYVPGLFDIWSVLDFFNVAGVVLDEDSKRVRFSWGLQDDPARIPTAIALVQHDSMRFSIIVEKRGNIAIDRGGEEGRSMLAGLTSQTSTKTSPKTK